MTTDDEQQTGVCASSDENETENSAFGLLKNVCHGDAPKWFLSVVRTEEPSPVGARDTADEAESSQAIGQ